MSVWTLIRTLEGGLVLAYNATTGVCERIPASAIR